MSIYTGVIAPPSLEKGFISRLAFNFDLTHDEALDVSYQFAGGYSAVFSVLHPIDGTDHYIGNGQLDMKELPISILSPLTKTMVPIWKMYLELPSVLAAQIDELRKLGLEQALRLRIRLDLLVEPIRGGSRQEKRTAAVMQRTDAQGSGAPIVPIQHKEWSEIMRQLGFPGRRYVEMRFPEVDRQTWSRAADDLAQADKSFDSRQDKQVMDYCENAFQEIFGRSLIMEGNEDKFLEGVQQQLIKWGLTDATRRELLAPEIAKLIRYIRRGKHLVDVPGHPEFDPNSADAELSLLMSKSVIGYLSKLATGNSKP
ncbi:MAG: hypothetical protein HY532_08245 [Chloroflexi bacterium]|nr:hypothetical protein [Chloroflexota bacterium]